MESCSNPAVLLHLDELADLGTSVGVRFTQLARQIQAKIYAGYPTPPTATRLLSMEFPSNLKVQSSSGILTEEERGIALQNAEISLDECRKSHEIGSDVWTAIRDLIQKALKAGDDNEHPACAP